MTADDDSKLRSFWAWLTWMAGMLAMLVGTIVLIIVMIDRAFPSPKLPALTWTAGLFLATQAVLTYLFCFQVNLFKHQRCLSLKDWTFGLLYGNAGTALLLYALQRLGHTAVSERVGVGLMWASMGLVFVLIVIQAVRHSHARKI